MLILICTGVNHDLHMMCACHVGQQFDGTVPVSFIVQCLECNWEKCYQTKGKGKLFRLWCLHYALNLVYQCGICSNNVKCFTATDVEVTCSGCFASLLWFRIIAVFAVYANNIVKATLCMNILSFSYDKYIPFEFMLSQS